MTLCEVEVEATRYYESKQIFTVLICIVLYCICHFIQRLFNNKLLENASSGVYCSTSHLLYYTPFILGCV